MGKDVIIYDNRLTIAKEAARKLERSIHTTYSQCEALQSLVESSNWKGSARDSFITYLDIIKQYHFHLKEAASLQTKALQNLENYKRDFRNDSSVKEVRNL